VLCVSKRRTACACCLLTPLGFRWDWFKSGPQAPDWASYYAVLNGSGSGCPPDQGITPAQKKSNQGGEEEKAKEGARTDAVIPDGLGDDGARAPPSKRPRVYNRRLGE